LERGSGKRGRWEGLGSTGGHWEAILGVPEALRGSGRQHWWDEEVLVALRGAECQYWWDEEVVVALRGTGCQY